LIGKRYSPESIAQPFAEVHNPFPTEADQLEFILVFFLYGYQLFPNAVNILDMGRVAD
jgi:hypothetical protein